MIFLGAFLILILCGFAHWLGFRQGFTRGVKRGVAEGVRVGYTYGLAAGKEIDLWDPEKAEEASK